jgi:acyl carrier protein
MTKEKIINIIKEKAKKDFDETTNLIAEGIVDSIDFIYIINRLEEESQKEIDFLDIDPNNALSVKGLWEIINGLE